MPKQHRLELLQVSIDLTQTVRPFDMSSALSRLLLEGRAGKRREPRKVNHRLLTGLISQTASHNRDVEIDACWREHNRDGDIESGGGGGPVADSSATRGSGQADTLGTSADRKSTRCYRCMRPYHRDDELCARCRGARTTAPHSPTGGSQPRDKRAPTTRTQPNFEAERRKARELKLRGAVTAKMAAPARSVDGPRWGHHADPPQRPAKRKEATQPASDVASSSDDSSDSSSDDDDNDRRRSSQKAKKKEKTKSKKSEKSAKRKKEKKKEKKRKKKEKRDKREKREKKLS